MKCTIIYSLRFMNIVFIRNVTPPSMVSLTEINNSTLHRVFVLFVNISIQPDCRVPVLLIVFIS